MSFGSRSTAFLLPRIQYASHTWLVRLQYFCTSYRRAVAMIARGFSWPSTSLVCSAEYTSLKLIGVGLAPSAVNRVASIGAEGTRSFTPFRSSGPLIGLVDVVTWRKPFSH